MDAAIRTVFEQGLGDATLQSIAWTDFDLLLDLELRGAPARNLHMRFTMVACLRIDLDYGNYVGQALLFSAKAQEIEHGRWKVEFIFGAAPDGYIEFECNDIGEDRS